LPRTQAVSPFIVTLDFSVRLTPRSRARPSREPATHAVLDLDDADARAAIDRLHVAVGAHVSARLGWLQAWRDADRRWRPWVLGLRTPGGDLRALAALGVRRHAGITQIRCLGHDVLDRAPIVSRSGTDARELALALAGELGRRPGPWCLQIRQLPRDDAFAAALSAWLPAVSLQPDSERPITHVDGGLDDHRLVSRNLHKAEARARNRIARANLECTVDWLRGGPEIARRLPEVRAVHYARDLQLRGRSGLDDPVEGRFYDSVFRRHLDALELLEIRFEGELGAYLAWIRNGSARLVLDNRVAPRWTAYSAGLIANVTALRAAAADPGIDVLDWGSGIQRYKLQAATAIVSQQRLHAWSSPGLRRALAARRRLSRPCRPGTRSSARS
jgi:hypothetical protein